MLSPVWDGRLYGVREGLLAALILATMPLAVRFAHLAIVDTPAVFWAVMALLWAVRARQKGRVRDFLAAGIFTGLAAATKYPAVLVAVPVATAILRGRPWPLSRSIWVVSGGCVEFCLSHALCLARRRAVLEPFRRYGTDPSAGRTEHRGTGWALPPALYPAPRSGRGGCRGRSPVPALERPSATVAGTRLAGWSSFPLAAVLALAGSTFMRYALPLTPLLALLIGRLVGMGWRYPLAGGLVTLILVAEPLYASLRTRSLLSGQDTRIEAQVWLQTHLPQYQEPAPIVLGVRPDPSADTRARTGAADPLPAELRQRSIAASIRAASPAR